MVDIRMDIMFLTKFENHNSQTPSPISKMPYYRTFIRNRDSLALLCVRQILRNFKKYEEEIKSLPQDCIDLINKHKFCWSKALFLEDYKPSGSLNFGRVDNPILVLKF